MTLGGPRVPTFCIAPEAGGEGSGSPFGWCSWPWGDGVLAGQGSGDQPNLKKTDTDYGSLGIWNRLPRARLGHHLTLPGAYPEREDSGKHWTLLR